MLLVRVAPFELSPAEERFGLSPRENSVLLVLTEGRTNREIAERLFISERTVAVHVRRILSKLGVGGRTEAAGMAIRLGLVPTIRARLPSAVPNPHGLRAPDATLHGPGQNRQECGHEHHATLPPRCMRRRRRPRADRVRFRHRSRLDLRAARSYAVWRRGAVAGSVTCRAK